MPSLKKRLFKREFEAGSFKEAELICIVRNESVHFDGLLLADAMRTSLALEVALATVVGRRAVKSRVVAVGARMRPLMSVATLAIGPTESGCIASSVPRDAKPPPPPPPPPAILGGLAVVMLGETHLRVPIRIEENHGIRRSQIYPLAASSCSEQKAEHVLLCLTTTGEGKNDSAHD